MAYLQTQKMIQDMITTKVIPGASYAIITAEGVEQNVIGNQQLLPTVQPLKPDEQYDVASLTKVVATTPVILWLLEHDYLRLTDSVSQFLPEWRYPQVTILNLLTHTTNFRGYIENRNQLSKPALIKAILNLAIDPQRFNREVVYQDYNFLLLGWIATKILGQPIQRLAVSKVLQPLKMTHSTFNPRDILNVVPTVYDRSTQTVLRGRVHDPKARILQADSGSAGLFSTLADLTILGQWLLGMTSHPDVISDELVAQLFIDQTPQKTNNRSFGWTLRQDEYSQDHPYILHTGYTGMVMVFDRQQQAGLIFMSNRIHPDEDNQRFIDQRMKLVTTFIKESQS